MDYYSAWLFFVCMALLLALSATPFFNSIAAPTTAPNGQRVPAIDGLRGFLAFGVFFGHAAFWSRIMLPVRFLHLICGTVDTDEKLTEVNGTLFRFSAINF
jgi:uncharacterized membrane protein YhaH (DUF805 family)